MIKRATQVSRPARSAGRLALLAAGLATLICLVGPIRCDTKDFDWSELGVSLAGDAGKAVSGTAGSSSSGPHNLRILVSPQRRSANKGYDYVDYANNGSQSAQDQPEAHYMASSGSGRGQQTHASAYSALSASLASLKSRLNARGVSLSSSIPESGSNGAGYGPAGHNGSSVYEPMNMNNNNNNGNSNQQQVQLTPMHMTPTGQQQQTGYLSVGNQADSHSHASMYSTSQSGSDNKTIVLAIPAKINFLADGRPKQMGQQQQHQSMQQVQPMQQMGPQQPQQIVYQTANDQQIQYAPKQQMAVYGPAIDGSSSVVVPGMAGQDHDSGNQQQQYVIINQANGQPMEQANMHVQMQPQPQQQPQMQQMPMQPMQLIQPQQQQQMLPMGNMYQTGPSSKNCCGSRGPYETAQGQYEHPSADKVGEVGAKTADDAYYNYLYRKSRARRSRRHRQGYGSATSSRYHNRYPNGAASSEEESNSGNGDSAAAGPMEGARPSSRGYSHESPYVKYYKIRAHSQQEGPTHDMQQVRKYSTKETTGRRARSRDFDQTQEPGLGPQQMDDDQAEQQQPRGSSGSMYSTGSDYQDSSSGRYGGPQASQGDEEEVSGRSPTVYEQEDEYPVAKQGASMATAGGPIAGAEYQAEGPMEGPVEERDTEPEHVHGARYSSAPRRRKNSNAPRLNKPKRLNSGNSQANKDGVNKYNAKKVRKSKLNSKQYERQSSQNNSSTPDYESAQPGDQQHTDSAGAPQDQEQDQHSNNSEYGEAQDGNQDGKDNSYNNKHKAALNESTVAHLSKTTMHLKEILSILEKKAYIKANDTNNNNNNNGPQQHYQQQQQQSHQQQQQQPQQMSTTTTTSSPVTTMGNYQLSSLLGPHYSSAAGLSSSLSNDFLSTPEFQTIKSPYRFMPSSLSSTIGSPSISLPSYSSLASDTFSSLPAFGPTGYHGLPSTKHLALGNVHHPRKRRPQKPLRYNGLVMPKTHGGLGATSASLLQAAAKSTLLPAYYSSLQYPYWYARGSSPSVTNSYPYKNLNKNPYTPLLNGMLRLK